MNRFERDEGKNDVETFLKHIPDWIEAGAKFIGGCCGITSDKLKIIKSLIDSFNK